MRYPEELYRKADEVLQSRRMLAAWILDKHKDTVQKQHSDIYRLYEELQLNGAVLGPLLITCNPVEIAQQIAKQESRKERLAEALAAAGLPLDYLQLQPACPLCRDLGYCRESEFATARRCQCRQEILNQLAYDWLSTHSQVRDCSFEDFDLKYYEGDNARWMAKVLESCKRYAEGFTPQSPDLLFRGPTGLGKTHLSLAIAAQVVSTGRLVLYASAGTLLDRLADDRFGKAANPEYKEIAYGCELLIIDDLGAEFGNSFTQAAVYNLVNIRRIEHRPTIINTNLTFKEIGQRYGQRVLSRLANDYQVIVFEGKDIRYQKRAGELSARKEKV